MSRPQELRTARLLRSRLPITPRRPSTRNLQIEQLESRVVLSGLPTVEMPVPELTAVPLAEADCVVGMPDPVPSIDTATTSVSPAQHALDMSGVTADAGATTDSSSTGVDLVLSIPTGDVTVPTVPTAPTGGGGGPSGSGQPLLPPVIIEFDAICQSGVWLFTGRVLDDTDVTGLTIHFGGILAGRTATVDDEGFFELITTLAPGTSGFVTVYTIDLDGLQSEIAALRVN